MELKDLISRQREFDERHASKFEWSQRASSENTQPLLYVALALAGEIGELANVVKKLERGDITYEQALVQAEDEAADVLIYLLKLSYQTGIDLEAAFINKQRANEVRFAALAKPHPKHPGL